MITRWWWVRHAPVPDGGRIYGQRDLDCDCSAAPVFDALAGALPRDAVWVTSNLIRTVQTAAAIRSAMRHPFAHGEPRAVPALAEQNLGDWQGLDRKAFLATRRSAENPHWFAPPNERAPNGESFADLVVRTHWAIDLLADEFMGRNIVAVTHGGTIRAAISHALRVEPGAVLGHTIDNCSLTRIERRANDSWHVVTVNERPWHPARQADSSLTG